MSENQASSGAEPQEQEGQRLSKRVMQLQSCSRSVAEQFIEGGWVTIDGRMVEEPGTRVTDEQHVEVSPDANLLDLSPVTLLLNQPPRIRDPLKLLNADNHAAVANDRGTRVLQRHFKRLHECAQLPTFASGLAVFTQDRNIARRLIEDASMLEHECIVEVSGDVGQADLASLRHGGIFEGRQLPPAKVSQQNETHLRFALAGTAVPAIARLCSVMGLSAVEVRRIRIGRVPLAKLAEGQWRYLGRSERF